MAELLTEVERNAHKPERRLPFLAPSVLHLMLGGMRLTATRHFTRCVLCWPGKTAFKIWALYVWESYDGCVSGAGLGALCVRAQLLKPRRLPMLGTLYLMDGTPD